MAYQDPNDPTEDEQNLYRQQMMKSLQQQAPPDDVLPTGSMPTGATIQPPSESASSSSSGAAKMAPKITDTGAATQTQLRVPSPATPATGSAAPSEPTAAPGPAKPPTVNDPESVRQWVIAEAKRLGRLDIAGNPDYWVQQAIAHSDKGDGTVDTGYWSNRMQIANRGGGGAASAAFGQMTPGYLGGAGPGNFAAAGANQPVPGATSDTIQQILDELAASSTGQQSPLGRRLQMQQLQDAQQQPE